MWSWQGAVLHQRSGCYISGKTKNADLIKRLWMLVRMTAEKPLGTFWLYSSDCPTAQTEHCLWRKGAFKEVCGFVWGGVLPPVLKCPLEQPLHSRADSHRDSPKKWVSSNLSSHHSCSLRKDAAVQYLLIMIETRNPANFKGNNGKQHLKTISCWPSSSCYSRQIFQFGGLVSRIQQVVATFIVDFQVRNVCCVDLAAVLVAEEGKDII